MTNKTRNSVYNSITALLFTIVNGLCNLLVTRKIISVYGSDFNGLNSTATQFINILLIIEGGFAVAANVALFVPLRDNDGERVSSVFSAVAKRFRIIGFLFTVIGAIGAIAISFIIRTSIPYNVCLCVFLMLIVSTGFGLFYCTKYKVLLQSDQTEYIINIVSIITYLLSYSFMYVAICFEWHMLFLRLIVMVFAIANSLIIGFYCKKKYRYINKKTEPDFGSIKGTKDVFVQKIVGVIYYSAPILIISSLINTTVASVYAVYNMVFTLIRSAENSIINSPRMSLGRLIAEKGLDSEDFKKVYNEYECCTFLSISVFISVSAVMIMPFIKLYTQNVTDISYVNWFMALILMLTCYIECIHIPAGNLINMEGKFKEGKIIQLISGFVLIVSILIGGFLFGINGIIVSVLLTAFVLAILEISYTRFVLLKNNLSPFFKNFFVNILLCAVIIFGEFFIPLTIDNFMLFFLFAFCFFIVHTLLFMLFNYLLNKTCFKSVCRRFISLFKRRKQ